MLQGRTWISGVVLAVLSSASVGAQAPREAPVFSSDVELITVDAVVVDKHGLPVSGLTKDDFVVKEDGKVQEVASFEAFVLDAASASANGAAASSAPAASAADAKRPIRSFALVIDDLWLTTHEAYDARRDLVRFVDKSLGRGDRLTVATTSGAIWEEAQLPEGRDKLVAALDAVRGLDYDSQTIPDYLSDYEAFWIAGHPQSASLATVVDRWSRSGPCMGGGGPACAAMVAAQAQAMDAHRQIRTRSTLGVLQIVMQSLRSERGRKSVLFVSKGFINDGDPVLRQTSALSREVNAAIYFLDARGLLALQGSGIPSAAFPGPAPDPSLVSQIGLQNQSLISGGAQDLAIDTGGFTVRNSNDIGIGASRIADQSRAFYLLGFHPPAGKKPGDWRKLKVELKQKGFAVHARRGYAVRVQQVPKPEEKGALGGSPLVVRAEDADEAGGRAADPSGL